MNDTLTAARSAVGSWPPAPASGQRLAEPAAGSGDRKPGANSRADSFGVGVRAGVGLSVRGLRWFRAGRWILDGIDLDLAEGETVGLLGPNGAGKTVTLSMIAGLLRPTEGKIFLGERDMTGLALTERARLGLGFLPQERSIFTRLSAQDNIRLILEARGFSPDEVRHRTHELLDRFGLFPLADVAAKRLSGGEQRRLEVARSIAIEPHFLLFDEPFAGIDPLTIASLHEMVQSLRNSGVGILITDHNVRETLSLCDRAYVLFAGRVLASGTPQELVANPEVRRHFLGDAFDAAVGGGTS